MMKAVKNIVRKYYKYGNTINAIKVGNPTVNNGVASGFSNGNNFTFPKPLNFNGQTWEIVFKVTTGSTGAQTLYGNYGNAYQNSPQVGIDSNKFQMFIPKDGSTSYLIGNTYGTYTPLANTTYWLKLYWTGTQYRFDYSLDSENWINDISVNNSTAMYNAATQGSTIGCNYYDTDSSHRYPWLGSIDFKECYIKVNNELWWNGTLAEESTSSDYDFFKDITKTYAVRSKLWK